MIVQSTKRHSKRHVTKTHEAKLGSISGKVFARKPGGEAIAHLDLAIVMDGRNYRFMISREELASLKAAIESVEADKRTFT